MEKVVGDFNSYLTSMNEMIEIVFESSPKKFFWGF
jgi:hypothetical protein